MYELDYGTIQILIFCKMGKKSIIILMMLIVIIFIRSEVVKQTIFFVYKVFLKGYVDLPPHNNSVFCKLAESRGTTTNEVNTAAQRKNPM